MKTKSQNYKILMHLLNQNSISWLTAAKNFGCASLHRRLADLRSGFRGIMWPIDFGTWVEHGGKRYKIYNIDLTKALELMAKYKKKG